MGRLITEEEIDMIGKSEHAKSKSSEIISADAFMVRVCQTLQIRPERVSRLVMDMEAGKPIKCYVEYYAGEELLKLSIPSGIELRELVVPEVSRTF